MSSTLNAPEETILDMTDAEFGGYVGEFRAACCDRFFASAISWRAVARSYGITPGARAMALRYMRESALAWRKQSAPQPEIK